MSIEKLYDAMDAEAVKLLDRIHEGDLDVNGDPIKTSVINHTKAFLAVVDYAMLRAKIEPPKPEELKESRFAAKFREFHGLDDGADGGAPKRRGRRPRSEEVAGNA